MVVSEAELVGQVVAVVLVLLDRSDLAILVDVAVDLGGNGGQLSNEVHGILESVLPVLGLVHALSIGLGEVGLALKSSDGQRELSHGVQVAGAAVDQLLDELGHVGAGRPLGREIADLLLRGNLAGQEKPEKTLRKGLLASRGLGEHLLALRNGLAAEADTLLRVEDGALMEC
jgi:hypothetical protein